MKSTSTNMEQYDWSKFTAIVCALVGGVVKFLQVYTLEISYWVSLGKAAFTALVCGMMGLIGKWLLTSFTERYKNKKWYIWFKKTIKGKKNV